MLLYSRGSSPHACFLLTAKGRSFSLTNHRDSVNVFVTLLKRLFNMSCFLRTNVLGHEPSLDGLVPRVRHELVATGRSSGLVLAVGRAGEVGPRLQLSAVVEAASGLALRTAADPALAGARPRRRPAASGGGPAPLRGLRPRGGRLALRRAISHSRECGCVSNVSLVRTSRFFSLKLSRAQAFFSTFCIIFFLALSPVKSKKKVVEKGQQLWRRPLLKISTHGAHPLRLQSCLLAFSHYSFSCGN